MATSKKPRPSKARSASSQVKSVAAAPTMLDSAIIISPVSRLRRSPHLSAPRPTTKPSTMPATWTVESKNPACTKDMPSCCCSRGTAGGSLPTCSEALTPAATMIHEGFRPRLVTGSTTLSLFLS